MYTHQKKTNTTSLLALVDLPYLLNSEGFWFLSIGIFAEGYITPISTSRSSAALLYWVVLFEIIYVKWTISSTGNIF